jgi:glycosyltransferase involved in cell wall biosynthesis
MRVLVVHNRYRSALPSGENMGVDQEIAMLRDAGVAVDTYIRDSDEIEHFGPVKWAELAVRPIYSLEDAKAFKALIRSFGPDVVHLHNPYPLISPAVIRVAKAEGVPVVQTVHNYRFACANGLYFRDGRVCQDCLGKRVPWPAVRHSCYRGSMPQSAIMAGSLAVHHATWQMVDRFLPVSDFMAEQLVAAGVPPEKITVKPNAVPDPGEPAPFGDGFLFAGRLEEEKGIKLLLEAWCLSGLGKITTLTIVGDGVERGAVQQAARVDPSISYLGSVPADQVGQLLDQCAVRVVPSLWFEGFPLAVIESFARGRPVVATSVGSLRGLVTDSVGWLADPTAEGLAVALASAASDSQGRSARGSAARGVYSLALSPGVVVAGVLDSYLSVIGTLQPSDRAQPAGSRSAPPTRSREKPASRRVAVVTWWDAGAWTNVATDLSNGMAQRGWIVRAMFTQLTAGTDLTGFDARVEVVPLGPRASRAPLAIARQLRSFAPDVTIALGVLSNGPTVIAHRLAGRPGSLVLNEGSCISYKVKEHAEHPFISRADTVARLLYPLASGVVCASEGVQLDLRDKVGISPSRLETIVIPNPIDLDRVRRLADAPLSVEPPRAPLVIALGRLAQQKNPLLLLRAFAGHRLAGNAGVLAFVGDGPLRCELERQASRLGVRDDVVFTGWLSNPYPYLRRADLLVLPSEEEGFGLVLVEAMALGVAVVATDCPGGVRSVLGDAGVLVDNGDEAALRAAITALLADDTERRLLGKRGKARSECFSTDHIIDEWATALTRWCQP